MPYASQEVKGTVDDFSIPPRKCISVIFVRFKTNSDYTLLRKSKKNWLDIFVYHNMHECNGHSKEVAAFCLSLNTSFF